MLRKISVALVAAAVTALIAGNSASAKDLRQVEHGPIAKPIESPPQPIEHPSSVGAVGVFTPVAPAPKPKPQPGPGGPVPTTGGGGGGFTDLPGAPVVCLGAEWRCNESVN
jgi:hypothetical protein